ncbi:site-specific integrase [Burkholderia stabilis]|uniref:site-specific integrase n=1 Tax=Burkholderia stabilis TaxID=95485 RepID=UPI0021BBF85E|nr:site-specific integrase [Burkholderia stabilis]
MIWYLLLLRKSMAFLQLSDVLVPGRLRGVTLVDKSGVPRYWANVWLLVSMGHLAESTQTGALRYVEDLYRHADGILGVNGLDDALAEMNDKALADVLESWFVSIRNRPKATRADELRWHAGLGFVTEVLTWLSKGRVPDNQLRDMEARLHRLSTLYGQLHVRKSGQVETIRSLPSSVVEALYELLDPESDRNPFKNAKTRWRVYVAFVLMLHQGLRRGELLLLTADCVKSGFDNKRQALRHWLNVQQNEYEDDEADESIDPRYSKPSIKTVHSVRQIPVSPVTAQLVQTYVENYRGRPAHPFLLNSYIGNPLATESLTRAFRKASHALPSAARQELIDRCDKDSVTPHDLRHTCAVVRLHQLLLNGDQMDEALQKMRTFFGWSKKSVMPSRYARAVFEDRLADVWNDSFDDRVALLRAIPKGL